MPFSLPGGALAAIEPYLPKNQQRVRRIDDRRVISDIPHVLKVDRLRCDCPTDYGPLRTVYDRFDRCARDSC